jgi:diguanylate cyclase (GGDEF)-like protein/PAS domain S-box-containing protein
LQSTNLNAELRRQSDADERRDDSDVGLQWISANGTILKANTSTTQLLGYEVDEYVGRNVGEYFLDADVLSGLLEKLKAGRSVRNLEARLRHRDGTVRYVQISANAVIAMGNFIHARIVMRDISDRKQSEFALLQFKEMVDASSDAIIAITLEGVCTYWNRSAERLYGYSAAEMIGRSVAVLNPDDMPNELPDLLAKLRAGERVEHFEGRRIRKDGEEVEVSVTLSPILDANRRPIGATAITRDVTERRKIEKELRHGAFHDALTNLPNRVYFNERVASALEQMRRDSSYLCAVLFLDFDGFKLINDSLGHLAGDKLLILIADRLRECMRPGDVVARLGGDEFTVLLDNVNTVGDINRATSRLTECLSRPHILDNKPVIVTASIGVAKGDPSYERPEDLVRDADIAMYHAKARGHARAELFDVEMRQAAHARFGVTADLRMAMEQKQFRLVYQPIVDLGSGRVHSFEALIRWDHPTKGEIQPTDFIPIAEQTGLIVPIGVWALQEACMQAREWQRQRRQSDPVRVSVNLSATQIVREAIVDEVREALRVSSLDPHALQLEITEGILLENSDLSTKRLEALRLLDVELHVDDFGTGYSWLSYLPQFPLQAIKIDRSFVHRMGARRTDLAIVRSIIELASTLGLSVIAEGVETVVQRKNLLRFGCTLGQGFLFAKPMSAMDAKALVMQ